jgi:hypothetical protein
VSGTVSTGINNSNLNEPGSFFSKGTMYGNPAALSSNLPSPYSQAPGMNFSIVDNWIQEVWKTSPVEVQWPSALVPSPSLLNPSAVTSL